MRKKLKDFFSMSKSERRGAYVVLLIMAVVMMTAVFKGQYDKVNVDVSQEQIKRIEKLDSLEKSIKESGIDTLKKTPKQKKSRKRKAKNSRSDYKDRTLEDVPQY